MSDPDLGVQIPRLASPARDDDAGVSRRGFLQHSLAAVGPMVATVTLPIADARSDSDRAPLSIVCVGAHPDDPESGCGGTLARYTAAGHVVRIVYLTRGERGIDGKSLEDAAHIRTLEAEAACVVLGATPVFFGQVDGATEVNAGSQTGAFRPDTYVDISAMVEKKKAALLAHASQDGAGIWRMHHEPMANWRGRESGALAAEGFVRLPRAERRDALPGS